MTDIKSKGKSESVPKLTKNAISLDQAVQTVRTVLMNFQGFDKLNEVLTLAQGLREQQRAEAAAAKALVDEANATVTMAQEELSVLKAEKDSVLKSIAQAKKQDAAARAKAMEDFQADMIRHQEDIAKKAKDEALVAQTNFEENVAGLKREIGALTNQRNGARDTLDKLTKQVSDRTAELAAVDEKLSVASAALAALKAKL